MRSSLLRAPSPRLAQRARERGVFADIARWSSSSTEAVGRDGRAGGVRSATSLGAPPARLGARGFFLGVAIFAPDDDPEDDLDDDEPDGLDDPEDDVERGADSARSRRARVGAGPPLAPSFALRTR